MKNKEPLILGIDAGTTRIRTLAFSLDGALVAEGSAPTPIETAGGNRSDFDPEALWQATVRSIRQAVSQIDDPSRIRGIAAASVGESGVALDGSHRVLARSLAWYDRSPRRVTESLAGKIDVQAQHMITGMRLSPLAGISKILLLQQENPTAFAATRHWLNVADFIAFRLSGVMATDHSLAGRMACLDMSNGEWSNNLLDRAGIPPALLPPVCDNGAPLGPVLGTMTEETGLPAGCMVSVGGHDHIIGALAAGVFASGAMLDSLGTAEALLLPTQKQTMDPRLADWGLVQSRLCIDGNPHWYICGDLATSSASIEWFRTLFAQSLGYDEMMQDAAAVEAGAHGVLFLPHLRIGSLPDRHPAPSGAFLNLSAEADRAVLYRAVLEGLAFDACNIRDHLMALLPADAQPAALSRPITVIGGGSQNALLLRIKAAAFNSPLNVVQSREAVSLGAAMLAGLGSGDFRGLAEATASVKISMRMQDPEAQLSAAYAAIYRTRFKPAVDAMRRLQH